MRLNISIVVAITGFCLLCLGLLSMNFIFPKLEIYLIEKETALQEGSKTFETWKKIPFPFKFKIYFFNVTNPNEVHTGSEPVLKEMGPYIYDEYRQREVLSVNEENDTIKYVQRKKYYFNQEESGCRSENDVVTILNFAVVSMAQKIYTISPSALSMVNEALPFLYPGIQNVFITNSVRNILFDGLLLVCESEEVDMICDGLRDNKAHTIRPSENGRDFLLSLFHHINGTTDGPYEIGRGLKTTVKGKMVSFKDKTAFTVWRDECNKIKGTDLTINPNLLTKPKKVNFFAPDFCRYFSTYFQNETAYKGLQVYIFESKNLLEGPENCFCGGESEDDEELPVCGPKGTMNVKSCSGSPIVLSQPHFLNADRSLLKFCPGLQPNRQKHATYITLEPRTGLALLVQTRFQMNIFVRKFDGVDVLQNVSEGLFPFIWLETGAQVPDNILEEIRNNFDKLKILDWLKYLLIVVGVLMLGLSVILAMIKDKLLCFVGRKNAVSVSEMNRIGRLVNLYDFKPKNGKPIWRISD